MVKQSELQAVMTLRRQMARLAKQAAVREYIQACAEEKARMKALDTRVEAGEDVQAGPLRFVRDVKVQVVISWKDFWGRVRELPPIARALVDCPDAQALIGQVTSKDSTSDLVGERKTVKCDVVMGTEKAS